MKNYIQAFENYLKKNKKSSENTILSYMRDVNKFNDFLVLNNVVDISSTTENNVKQYIDHLTQSGKSISTIGRTLASLKSFFVFLQSKKVIEVNPVKNIKTNRTEKKLPRILTGKEVELFLKQPKCDSLKGYRDKAMLELLYATGIRVSELIALDITDLNIDVGFIKCGKGSGERVIPLYSAAVIALKEYLTTARPLLISEESGNALFVNLNGARMTRQGFWKIIKHYQSAANISTEITPHILRHSFAAHLLENGADIDFIKEIMGHSDISSTLIYTQLLKSDLKTNYIKFHPRAN